jgi:hypothetical protein
MAASSSCAGAALYQVSSWHYSEPVSAMDNEEKKSSFFAGGTDEAFYATAFPNASSSIGGHS